MRTNPSDEFMTVEEFCTRFRISRSMFYKLQHERRGPRTIKLGRKTLVRSEEANLWSEELPAAKYKHIDIETPLEELAKLGVEE